jgi:hypothetical protein
MAFTSLAQRLTTLPLVLAGPILRRVEKKQVSVWIALKEERELKLVIYDDQGQVLIESTPRNTVKLGAHLHVLVLTAKFPPGPTELQVGQIYGYSVVSQTSDLTPYDDVTYFPERFSRPTFTLPPATLNDLRIIHGSCRKMHAPGEDAFVVLDKMLEDESCDPTTYAKARPHQLFLTGDQIYADDVEGLLLHIIKDACHVLMGWDEVIYDKDNIPITDPSFPNSAPGMRGGLIDHWSGFKFPLIDGGIPLNTSHAAASHLMFLGEYYCMYLLMWSPVLWPAEADKAHYPTLEQVYKDPLNGFYVPSEDEFKEALAAAFSFQQQTVQVRRSLANVPTYMICDDHEITDDWFITREWTHDVLNSTLGSRIVLNGMTAYALFQAWGNTPEQFYPGTAGGMLLNIIPEWTDGYSSANTVSGIFTDQKAHTYYEAIASVLGMPDWSETDRKGYLAPLNPSFCLRYDYQIAWDKHEVIVLNTRTERTFPGKDQDSPVLIRQGALEMQLNTLSDNVEVTFIVVPTPVSGIPNIEEAIAGLRSNTDWVGGIYFTDSEYYAAQPNAVRAFYGLIGKRVAERQARTGVVNTARIVLLSGDVHYGFTNRVEYWGLRSFTDSAQMPVYPDTAHFVLAQLCASALKNEKGVINDSKMFGKRTGSNKAQFDGYTPDELDKRHVEFGWVDPGPNVQQVVGRMYTGSVLGPVHVDVTITHAQHVADPDLTVAQAAGFGLTLSVAPDWTTRINYLTAVAGTPRPQSVLPEVPADPTRATPGLALDRYLAVARNKQAYMQTDGPGREAVGKNNIGEIRFSWGSTEETKVLRHQLWWRMDDKNAPTRVELPPYPLSEYEVIMGETTKYPRPVS